MARKRGVTLRGISTEGSKIIWEKYNTPNTFIYKIADIRYILNSYKTLADNKTYDCVSLTVIDSKGRAYENCVGCNDVQYMEDYVEIKRLYDVMLSQFKARGDREIENLLEALPS